MQTTEIGNRAEQKAVEYLDRSGYEIIDRNWRRRDCEIDIVAKQDGALFFVEVKYRSVDSSGSGLEFITKQKVRRMSYGASRWVQENHWNGEYQLAAVEVSGVEYEVTAFIKEIY